MKVFIAVSIIEGLRVEVCRSKRILAKEIGVSHYTLQKDLGEWVVVKGWMVKEVEVKRRRRGRSL